MPVATRPMDTANELATKVELEAHWAGRTGPVTLYKYPFFDPCDWGIEYRGRTIGIAELKTRTVPIAQYDTVYLSAAKALNLEWSLLRLKRGVFVVRYTDRLAYIEIRDVPRGPIRKLGRTDRVDMPNDLEPIIEVPTRLLTVIR